MVSHIKNCNLRYYSFLYDINIINNLTYLALSNPRIMQMLANRNRNSIGREKNVKHYRAISKNYSKLPKIEKPRNYSKLGNRNRPFPTMKEALRSLGVGSGQKFEGNNCCFYVSTKDKIKRLRRGNRFR